MNAAEAVDCLVVEVEHVSVITGAAGAVHADPATLHGVSGRGVDRLPVHATVVSEGYVEVPHRPAPGTLPRGTAEVVGDVVTRVALTAGTRRGRVGADERDRSTVGIAGDHFGELHVLDAESRADVDRC